jgi:hypothetical protein
MVSHDDSATRSQRKQRSESGGLNRTILVLTDRELVARRAGRFLLSKNRFRKLVLQALLPDCWACRY